MRNPLWCPLWIIVGLSMLLLLICCVYLTAQMHIRAYILLSHNVGHWITELSLQREESCAHQCGFSNLPLLISHNPPALTCQSKTDGLTSDIWSLNGILIGSLAARGLLIHCLSLNTHKHIFYLCVCVILWSILGGFFDFFFVVFFALLCTAWTIRVIVTKSSRKDFKEITIILLSFFLVFQMQKECFSLPAIKATITLFLYTNGAKNISIWIYI